MLVALGVFTRLDQFACDHLMPGLAPMSISGPTLLDVLLPLGDDRSPAALASDLWLYPASAPLSWLLVCVCALVLWRRDQRRAAVLWPSVWIFGVGVEVLTKHVLARPELVSEGYRIGAFDHALPSGHALRAVLVAAAIAWVWPRYGRPAFAWAATVPPLLVASGWHTPTDVVASLFLAGALVLVLHETERSGVDRRPLLATAHD